MTWLLIAPSLIYLLFTFVVPLAVFVFAAVDNREISNAVRRTSTALANWDGAETPGEEAFSALAADLRDLDRSRAAVLARQLNYYLPGMRSLVIAAYDVANAAAQVGSVRDRLLARNAGWADVAPWRVLRDETGSLTSHYVLSSVDLMRNQSGIGRVPPDRAVFIDTLIRTIWISFWVTVACLALGFPTAYLLSVTSGAAFSLAMFCLLLPFWTSALVRSAAWVILLQKNGLVNQMLLSLGVVSEPVQLIFNRFGVYVAMTHVLLPFMILPLYAVLKRIPRDYMRAAASLGASPLRAFWHVFIPNAAPGLFAPN